MQVFLRFLVKLDQNFLTLVEYRLVFESLRRSTRADLLSLFAFLLLEAILLLVNRVVAC